MERALDGRTAIVTGAGSGIGRAVARRLAAAGASVVCADIAVDAGTRTVRTIEEAGGTARSAPVDVGDADQVRDLVDETVDTHGTLDVMCNIAGIAARSHVVDTTVQELDTMMKVTVTGAYFGCQAAARAMITRGSGSIVNMSSTAIDVPTAGLATYTIAKAAVVSLTRVLAVELGPHGVRVNAVAPGFVPTPLTVGSESPEAMNADAQEAVNAMARRVPLGRVGRLDEVAETFLFLASDASSYITGQTIRPNGGISMPW